MQKLYIITPFKNNISHYLLNTIKSISSLKLKTVINHIVIYDRESIELIDKIKSNYLKNFKFESYFIKFIIAPNKGIYDAINIGLDQISKNSFYMVLGEGDLIKKKSNDFNLKNNQIQTLGYKLSNRNKLENDFRNIYSGMPYCHNAIIFKKNDLKYSTNYKISSDYHYFIKYIENSKINIENDIPKNSGLEVTFEAKNGISSKSIIKKNIENMLILIKLKKLKGFFIYLILLLPKLFHKFRKKYAGY